MTNDPFKDFDRDFARSTARFNVMFNLITLLVVLVFVAMIVAIGMFAHDLARLGDDGIAKYAGHLAGVFMKELDAK